MAPPRTIDSAIKPRVIAEAAAAPAAFNAVGMQATLSAGEFQRIAELMYQRFGIDLRRGKEGLVASRLNKKLRQGGFRSFDAYFEHAVADKSGDALIEMVDALTTNHTSFLRERAHFDFLVKTILPSVPPGQTMQIWTAACSTGEEPYSIACTLLDAMKAEPKGCQRFRILATDLSTRVLNKAKAGIYPDERFQDVPAHWKQAYLTKGTGEHEGSFRMKPEVSNLIEFRRLNLMEPMNMGRKFHLILCRNVMMYFDRVTQQGVVKRLSDWLEPGGYFYVGHSETLTGIEHKLRYLKPAIYQNDGGAAPVQRNDGVAPSRRGL